MTKTTAIKLNNKKQWVIDQVVAKGFMSYKQIINVTGWDLNNLHSTFRASVLNSNKLIKTTMHGRKGYTLNNKSKAVRAIFNNRKSIAVSDIMELTSWNSHVLNSVLRKSTLDLLNIVKIKKGKQLLYKVA